MSTNENTPLISVNHRKREYTKLHEEAGTNKTFSRPNPLYFGQTRDFPTPTPISNNNKSYRLSMTGVLGGIVTLLFIAVFFMSPFIINMSKSHNSEFVLKSTSRTDNIHHFQVFKSGTRTIIAKGVYYLNYKGNGWHHLQAKVMNDFYSLSNPYMFKDYFTSIEALGYLEGYVTCTEINHYYVNFYSGLFDGGDPMEEAVSFLQENHDWMTDMAEKNWRNSNYWLSVKILLVQLEGMLKGLQQGCPGSMNTYFLSSSSSSQKKQSSSNNQNAENNNNNNNNIMNMNMNKKAASDRFNGVYLPSLHKGPALIHLLLLNANGDLYQIAQKFNQPLSPPTAADDDVYTYNDDDALPYDLNITNPDTDDDYIDSDNNDNIDIIDNPTSGKNKGNKSNNNNNNNSNKKSHRSLYTTSAKDTTASTTTTTTTTAQTDNMNEGEDLMNDITLQNTIQSIMNEYKQTPSLSSSSSSSMMTPDMKRLDYAKKLYQAIKEHNDIKHSTDKMHNNNNNNKKNGKKEDAMVDSENSLDSEGSLPSLRSSHTAQHTHTHHNLDVDSISYKPRRVQYGGSHCSCIIKLTENYDDILYGHNTWDDYQCAGPRIFKQYTFPVISYVNDNGYVHNDDDLHTNIKRPYLHHSTFSPSHGYHKADNNQIEKDKKKDKNKTDKDKGKRQDDSKTGGIEKNTDDYNQEVFNYYSDDESSSSSTEDNSDNDSNNNDSNDNSINDILLSSSSSSTDTSSAASSSQSDETINAATETAAASFRKKNTIVHGNLVSTIVDMHFSSSPGYLTSIDDFFVIKGAGDLAVMETSEDVIDEQILTQITPTTMLSWARARVANQLAKSGLEWVDYFSIYHSGTYTNQWMVLDFEKFKPGHRPLRDSGLLMILEELPGFIQYQDVTHILSDQTYWASYNNPYFKDIRDISGNTEVCKVDPSYCYKTDPRAMIFKRLQNSIVDIHTLQKVLGYNHFKTDIESEKDSCNTISCRSDLEPDIEDQYPFGAIDSKVSSYKLSSSTHYYSNRHQYDESYDDDDDDSHRNHRKHDSSKDDNSFDKHEHTNNGNNRNNKNNSKNHASSPSSSTSQTMINNESNSGNNNNSNNINDNQEKDDSSTSTQNRHLTTSSSALSTDITDSIYTKNTRTLNTADHHATATNMRGGMDSSDSTDTHSDDDILEGYDYVPQIYARYGPTHDDLPPFCWSQFEGRVNIRHRRFSHIGQPECFNFNWQLLPPQ